VGGGRGACRHGRVFQAPCSVQLGDSLGLGGVMTMWVSVIMLLLSGESRMLHEGRAWVGKSYRLGQIRI
jgi:hypothetical protein